MKISFADLQHHHPQGLYEIIAIVSLFTNSKPQNEVMTLFLVVS